MAEKRQIILDIQANTGKIAERIAQINLELVQNRDKLTELNKKYKNNLLTQEQYAKSTSELKADTKGLRVELRDLEKQQELTTKATNAAEGSNEQLRAQSALLTKEINRLGRGVDGLDEEGQQLEKQLLEINTALKKNESAVGDNRRNVGNYQEAIENAIGSLGGFGGGLLNVRNLLKGGGVIAAIQLGTEAIKAIGRGVKEAIGTFIEFDQGLATLGAISGATAEELDLLEASARQLGETTQFSASQVVELQTNFARVGLDTSQILAATEATLDLALATGEDLASASEVVAATLGGYQLEAEETQRVTDVMAASFNSSALNLDKFRESTKLVAPVAAALNIDIETTTAALGSLADAGISGSAAGTGLRRIFSELGSEGSKLSERLGFAVTDSESLQRAFTQLAAEGVSVAEANELVGKLAAPAFLTLVEGSEDVAKLTEEFNNASGAAARTGEIVSDTAAGDIKEFESTVEGVAITLGDRLEPVIRGVIQAGTSLVRFLSGVFFEVWDVIADIFSPVTEALGDLVGLFRQTEEGAEETANQTSLLAGAFKLLSAPLRVVTRGIAFLVDGITAFVGWIKNAAQGSGIFANALRLITAPIRLVYEGITNLGAAAAGLRAAFGAAIDNIQAKAQLLVVNLELLAAKVEDFFSSGDAVAARIRDLENQRDELANVGTSLADAFTDAYNAAVQESNAAAAAGNAAAARTAGKVVSPYTEEGFTAGQDFGQGFNQGAEETIQAPAPPSVNDVSFDVAEPDFTNDPVLREEQARLAAVERAEQESRERRAREDAQWYEQINAFRKKKEQEQTDELARQEKERAAIAEAERAQRLAVAGAIAQAAQFGIDALGEETAAGKALGITRAIVSTYVAANQALATGGPFAGPILAAVAIATGLANVSEIVRAAQGGYISGPGTGTSDSIPALLSNGESVINASATARYWPVLDSINRSTGGNPIRPARFNTGGVAASIQAVDASLDGGAFAQQQAAQQQANAAAVGLQDSIINMPAPIVTVKDIDDTKKRVTVKERTRKL